MSLHIMFKCPCCDTELASFNITHNVNKMADLLGVYEALWRPEENGFVKADDIKMLVQAALWNFEGKYEELKALEPSNGWGTVEDFKAFLMQVEDACWEHPRALIEVSR